MSAARQAKRPIELCLRQGHRAKVWSPDIIPTQRRCFSRTVAAAADATASTGGPSKDDSTPARIPSLDRLMNDASSVHPIKIKFLERAQASAGTQLVGSRRRRVAMRVSPNVPFEQLPYQCFQEARKVLAADREEKLREIAYWSAHIKEVEAADPATFKDGERSKRDKLAYLRFLVERLKIRADINDPLVKRKFEDGLGDMNKPVYRHLARRRWESYERKLIAERVSQFNIVPDVLPKFEPSVDVQLYFRNQKVRPGDFVDSLVSENSPRLRIQAFDAGQRLYSVVVMDSDVPLPEEDAYGRRCHFLAANIPWSPTDASLPLSRIQGEDQLALPWLPAFAQKGAPYHRMSIFILEQPTSQTLDVAKLKELYAGRDGFSLKSFRDKFGVRPVGYNIFRSKWDDNTATVMERHNIPGADIEFKRQRVQSLKPPRKARGWEAKRQGPKYRSLWKYTKRIA